MEIWTHSSPFFGPIVKVACGFPFNEKLSDPPRRQPSCSAALDQRLDHLASLPVTDMMNLF